ncbi:Hypothetical predicted protein [Mytilus galloprovincialis]|uniref:Uncharacterized protein n=1 Tax=Mytilus galloprovincialis TaxID=29158 RepID=A0A8B6CE22_MYTGA|nr:Hypothetical predicted protein [Mytilus galloprovincialis]
MSYKIFVVCVILLLTSSIVLSKKIQEKGVNTFLKRGQGHGQPNHDIQPGKGHSEYNHDIHPGRGHSQYNQNTQPGKGHSEHNQDIQPGSKWGDDMFGHGCRCSFHLHCHSDTQCHHHGTHHICHYSCCGTRCERSPIVGRGL